LGCPGSNPTSHAPRRLTKKPPKPAKPFGTVPVLFVVAMILLSLGYQLHFSINSAPF
jgi:hypothetical protein